MKARKTPVTHSALLGFAVSDAGIGSAYLKAGNGRIVHVPFTVRTRPGLEGRDVAYAAVEAALRALVGKVERLELAISDARLIDDLEGRRDLPGALGMPYISLRCVLNRFAHVKLIAAEGDAVADLVTRARADVVFAVAA